MTPATQTENRINGLDMNALQQVVAEVQKNPASAAVKFAVSTRWQGQTRSESRVESYTLGGNEVARQFDIVADEPRELLGTNTAPNPQELLMAAVNACMTVGYVAGAATHGIELEELRIETDGALDLRGFLGLDSAVPAGYERIQCRVTVKGNGTPEQFVEIHANVLKTSPNYFNITRPIRFDAELVVE